VKIKLPFIGEISIDRRNSYENDPSYNRFKALIRDSINGKTIVTTETAMQVATAIRCVDVVAKDIASLPLHLYRYTTAGAEKARNERLYEILHSLPNPETTAFDFWLMYVYNLMFTPAAYAYVARDRAGFITEIYNMPSKYCTMRRNKQTGERYVEYWNGTIRENVYPENLMYTPGARLSDLDYPLDPIDIASRVLGLANSLNDFAQNYFDNGAQAGGVVNIKNPKKEELFKQFVKDFNDAYKSVQNAHKNVFLNGDAEFMKLDTKPNDSQALESRQHQVIEICRVFGVSPIKVFEYGRATYSNMEQVNIEYVNEALNPMAIRLEQTIKRDLIPSYQRNQMYAKWNFYALLKGDMTAQANWFKIMRQNGYYNANEGRELMDMNRIPTEEGGDAYLVNGNMISLKTAMNQQLKQTGNEVKQ
jgi:HK97 family phage portal protein